LTLNADRRLNNIHGYDEMDFHAQLWSAAAKLPLSLHASLLAGTSLAPQSCRRQAGSSKSGSFAAQLQSCALTLEGK
jgi:hypothetical protein